MVKEMMVAIFVPVHEVAIIGCHQKILMNCGGTCVRKIAAHSWAIRIIAATNSKNVAAMAATAIAKKPSVGVGFRIVRIRFMVSPF
jgi:hypothetical protein